MSGALKNILVVYPDNLNAAGWTGRYNRGEVPDRLPYGLSHLEKHGFRISTNKSANPIARQIDRLCRRLIGFDLIHPIPKRKLLKAAKPSAIITVWDTNGVRIGLSRAIGISPLKQIPHIHIGMFLGQKVVEAARNELRLLRYAFSLVNKIIVLSKNQKELLLNKLHLNEEQVAACEYGVDENFFLPGTDGPGDFVLSVGGDKGRDYDTLIAATAITSAKLLIVCRDWTRLPRIDNDRIKVIKNINHRTLHSLYKRAKFVVVPTRQGFVYPSGSTVLMEAMLMGKATIISDTPAIKDYLVPDKTAKLVPAEDPLSLANQINTLDRDQEARQNIGAAARLFALEKLTSSRWIERLVSVCAPIFEMG